MSSIRVIELCIAVALVLYFLAFFIARKRGKWWYFHIWVAVVAFVLDAYGTYVMWTMAADVKWDFHTISSIVALALFSIQAGLGIFRRKKLHVLFAKWIFLPTWVVSFLSGFVYLF
ncbi:hypothetical protein CL630_02525 [bacterium]|nr:hypothetical protein [bacterium]